MSKGIIFDMDGTLLDSMPVWESAGERYLGSLGVQAEPGLGKRLFAMNMEEGAVYLKDHYHLSDDIPAITCGINRTVMIAYENEIPLKEGVRELLDLFAARGMEMTVATLSDRALCEKAFQRLHISRYFRAVLTGTEAGKGKEEPDLYLAAQELMGTERSETWVFEDALFALKTAKRAGFRTAGVYDACSREQQEPMKELADLYIDSFLNGTEILRKMRAISADEQNARGWEKG